MTMIEIADEVNPEHVLHTIRDEAGRRSAEKLFKMYVREESVQHARSPAFLIALDRLLAAHGGAPVEDTTNDPPADPDEDYEDDEDTSPAAQLAKPRGGKSPPVEEDLPANREESADHEAGLVHRAVAALLRRYA